MPIDTPLIIPALALYLGAAALLWRSRGSPIWPQHWAKGCLLPQGQASNTLKILLVVVGCMALAE